MPVIVQLILALVVIVIAAEIFTNALEHLGEKLGISEGVTGSLFAAVGTAMPESMVPILALLAGTANPEVNHAIGVGAILGAPLMLSTLSLSIMGMSVFRQRGAAGPLNPERSGLSRDLNFFLLAFAVAGIALILPKQPALSIALALGLLIIYFFYILLTLKASAQLVENGHATETERPLFLSYIKLPDNYATIVAQLIVGLGLLIGGAKMFVHAVEHASAILGVSALLLSLLIIPIATELPEKVNSILWIRRRRDTLAFGNISGAMVFQGSVLPAIGIMLTPWAPDYEVVSTIIVAYIATLWLRFLVQRGQLRVWHLGVNGALYVLYLIAVLA
ncbi:MAG: sodium:calcium antiporter [Gammaproteobacteria bacterium]